MTSRVYNSSSYSSSISQKLLHKQGVGGRSTAIQNRFIKRWVIWFILITILALFYVWSRIRIVQLGYEINTLQKEYTELDKEAGSMEVEVEKLKSPKRLEEVAHKKLNMHPPKGDQIVLVSPEEIE